MTKLAKYLKPFIPSLLLAVVLLFGQAVSDLNLPNLMSDIVNVGIQQGGIEHAAPEALTPSGFRLMTAYMSGPDRQLAEDYYTAVAPQELNGRNKTYISLYPGMGETAYVRKPCDEPTLARLDDAFGGAAYRIVNRMGNSANSANVAGGSGADTAKAEAADNSTANAASNGMSFDLAAVYAWHSLAGEPGPAAEDSSVSDEAAAYSNQTGVLFVRALYQELGMNTTSIQTRYILRIGLYMLLIAFLGGLATVLLSFIATRVSAAAARNLRRDIFEKVEHFSHHEFDKFSSASLITRCTNDVTQMQMLINMGLRMICYAPIMGIGGIVMALNKSVSMSWIIALAVIVLLGLILVIMSLALPRFKIIQQLIDNLNKVSRENLSGLMVIRAFGAQKHEMARFDKANKDLTDTNLFVHRIMAFLMPAITLIMNGITLLIVWVGAQQIAASAMQIGDMMAFMQYAMQIIFAFMAISMTFIFVPRAAVSGARIYEVLSTAPEINDPEKPFSFNPSLRGTVVFDNVCFRYHDAEADALSGITFTAHPGQTTAIIGATGSGKSTVANLLMRFYDVTDGSISVDGADIRTVRQADLRTKIGYVPQKGVLLSGTVASNIRYGRKDASDTEIEEAAAVAQALDFISDKPEKFESVISQGGANVSGGQKQRLSIARALAKKPEILLFDDSFSALDFQTDAKLRKALKAHTAEATMIVVAQRVGTIMHAEQIVVLEEGRIVGIGTHEELIKSCPAYEEIASSQLIENAASDNTASENATQKEAP